VTYGSTSVSDWRLGALITSGAGDAAAPAPSDAESPLFPFYDHALLAEIEAADVVIIRRPVEAEQATGDGLTLEFLLYDRDDMGRRCCPSVNLPEAQIRSGFYMRGAVPFKLRVIVDQPKGVGLVLHVALLERARVRVYTETARRDRATGQPIWVDQIVVVTERLESTPA
jgi:hypothetical protein